jgi:hypothetical protein
MPKPSPVTDTRAVRPPTSRVVSVPLVNEELESYSLHGPLAARVSAHSNTDNIILESANLNANAKT